MNKNIQIDAKSPVDEAVDSHEKRLTLRSTGALILCAGLGIGQTVFATSASEPHPQNGDQLMSADADGKPVALRADQIPVNSKPIQVFPFDPKTGEVKNGSRLNKIILMRLAASELSDEMKAVSANGVVAYSSVCTHQGCEVSEWVAKDKVLMCYCHFSKFSPALGGEVVSGPAPRTLPLLPLREENGVLVVAGNFTSSPGVSKQS